MIAIGITGKAGAGKGQIVEHLIKKGFVHFSVRDLLNEEINRRGLPLNRDSAIFVANSLRKEKHPGYLAEAVYEKAKSLGKDCVIESLRTPGEVNTLRSHEHAYVIAVETDLQTRYERINKRNGEYDKVTLDEFKRQDQAESASTDPTKGNIEQCIRLADFVVQNNGTLAELEKAADEVMKQITSKRNPKSSYPSQPPQL